MHASKVNEQSQDKENLSQQANNLSTKVAQKTTSVSQLQQQIDNLDSAMASIRAESENADKRAEYALSLYNKITNITWNYEDNENLSGCKYYCMFNICV